MSKETLFSMHKKNVRSLETAQRRIEFLEESLNAVVSTVDAYKKKERKWAQQSMSSQQMVQQTINAMNIQSSKEKQDLIDTYNTKLKAQRNIIKELKEEYVKA